MLFKNFFDLNKLKKMINSLEKNNILSWSITIFLAIFIFYLSSLSFEKGAPGPSFPYKSYIYHFGIFFMFALSLFISAKLRKNKDYAYIIILIPLFYSILDEIHQLYVPNRNFSYLDIIIDYYGIMFAGFFYYISSIRQHQRPF